MQKKDVKATDTSKTVPIPKTRKSHKISKNKRRQIKLRKKYPRGIVYLGHIPHGFYEEEMTDYFKQFGKITRVRVVRSKNVSILIIFMYIYMYMCVCVCV